MRTRLRSGAAPKPDFHDAAVSAACAAGEQSRPVALFLAILAGRSDTGCAAGRDHVRISGGSSPAPLRPALAPAQVAPSPPRPSDAETHAPACAGGARTQRGPRSHLTRLAAVEHSLDDMTGSITKQIEAVKTAATAAAARDASSAAEWPSGESPPVPTAPMTIAAVAATAAPPPSLPRNPVTGGCGKP